MDTEDPKVGTVVDTATVAQSIAKGKRWTHCCWHPWGTQCTRKSRAGTAEGIAVGNLVG